MEQSPEQGKRKIRLVALSFSGITLLFALILIVFAFFVPIQMNSLTFNPNGFTRLNTNYQSNMNPILVGGMLTSKAWNGIMLFFDNLYIIKFDTDNKQQSQIIWKATENSFPLNPLPSLYLSSQGNLEIRTDESILWSTLVTTTQKGNFSLFLTESLKLQILGPNGELIWQNQ